MGSPAEDLRLFMGALARMLAPEIAAELRRMTANDEPRDTLLTRAECARALGVSIPTIDRAIRDGCPKVTIGRAVRFDLAAVRAWMEKSGKRKPKKPVSVPVAILREAGLKKG